MLRRRFLYKNVAPPISVEFNTISTLIGYVGEMAGISETNGVPDNIRNRYVKVTYSDGTTELKYVSETTFALYIASGRANFNDRKEGIYNIKLDITEINGISCNLRTTNSVEYKIIENKPYTCYWRKAYFDRNDFFIDDYTDVDSHRLYIMASSIIVEYLNGAMRDGYYTLFENGKAITDIKDSKYFNKTSGTNLNLMYPVRVDMCMPGYIYGYAYDNSYSYERYGYDGYAILNYGWGYLTYVKKAKMFSVYTDHYSTTSGVNFINTVKNMKSVVLDSITACGLLVGFDVEVSDGVDDMGNPINPVKVTTKTNLLSSNQYAAYRGPYNYEDLCNISPWTATWGSLQYTQFNFTDEELAQM